MKLPFISCVCVTAGRTEQLQEAIECFKRQDYEGESELVILNTLPEQELVCATPNVTVYNLMARPASLGEARNLAISMALGGHIVTWDDDDIYLPNHLSNFGKNFADNDWLWLGEMFYVEHGKIKSIVRGSQNVVAFTKAAWEGIGCYNGKQTVGEDRDFVGRLTSKRRGARVTLDAKGISFVYCWGQGAAVYHVSGQGDDRPGMAPAWARAGEEMQRRIRLKHVPTGEIVLTPGLKHDYEAMAKDFLLTSGRGAEQKKPLGIVLLGRYGDLINALPCFQVIAENYGRPTIVVSNEFKSLFDGISYVDAMPVEFTNDQLLPAIKVAEKHFTRTLVGQIWGKDWHQQKLTDAYNKESWRQLGFLHRFNDPSLRPLFDRRDMARELALCSKLDDGRPMMLLKLDGSVSSPCPSCHTLTGPIIEAFGKDFNIVDMSTIKTERIYDFLGLFDRAEAMVCLDTAFIHLAAGSRIPFVALTNPAPWLGTAPRGNCAARLPYSLALAHPEKVVEALKRALAKPKLQLSLSDKSLRLPVTRRLFHAVERHEQAPENRRERAQSSWDVLYAAGAVPAHLWDYPRTAKGIGDKRALPYLKDVLENAMNQAADDDVICFTNDDVWLHPATMDAVLFHIAVHGPCLSSQRMEFTGHKPQASLAPNVNVQLGKRHMGRDLFAFTKIWLKHHWAELPDVILGASSFDLMLAAMIRLEYRIETTRKNIEEHIHPAELPLGYVVHEHHKSFWNLPGNANSPSENHNKRLFKEWAGKHLPGLKFHAGNNI